MNKEPILNTYPLNQMNTKKFPLIPIERGYVMIGEEVPVNEIGVAPRWKGLGGYELFLNCSRKDGKKVIAHTGIPSLKDSGLPLFEVIDRLSELALNAAKAFVEKRKQLFNNQSDNSMFREGWIEGYKAAGGYTEKDMIEAFDKGYLQSGLDSLENQDEKPSELKTISDASKEFRQSLKKHPVAVVVEMEEIHDYTVPPTNPEDYNLYISEGWIYNKPKVVDGYIKIVEVIYE
jgi:hypothetical protein